MSSSHGLCTRPRGSSKHDCGLCSREGPVHEGITLKIRARELREAGAEIQLGPNAFRALDELGLQHAIEQIAFEPHALVLLDSPSGTEICRLELGLPFLERFGYSYRVGYLADVQQVLPAPISIHSSDFEAVLPTKSRRVITDSLGTSAGRPFPRS